MGRFSRNVALAFCAGLLAGVLTIVLPFALSNTRASLFFGSLFVGDIFGLVLSIYFWVFLRVRSIGKIVGFIITSTFSYIVAFYVTFFSAEYLPHAAQVQDSASIMANVPLAAPFIGGFVGALSVLLATLVLFSSETRLLRIIKRSLIWALAGGALGVVGWALGSSLGGIVVSALGQRDVSSNRADDLTNYGYSLFLIWQSGMGFVLGFLTQAESRERQTPRSPSAPLIRRPRSVGIAKLTMVAVAAIGGLFFAIKQLPQESQLIRSRRVYAKFAAETPTLDNLPEVGTAPAEQMLVLKTIAQYEPGRAAMDRRGGYVDPATGKLKTVPYEMYVVTYTIPGLPHNGPQAGPFINVMVQEYPNGAWAKHEFKDQNNLVYLDQLPLAVRFGNRVVEKTHSGWYRSDDTRYLWVSQNRLLAIELPPSAPDEFLQEYLTKYPSSL
jgi:MFS family permease